MKVSYDVVSCEYAVFDGARELRIEPYRVQHMHHSSGAIIYRTHALFSAAKDSVADMLGRHAEQDT